MSDTPTVETDQAAREASGAHPYGRYLEEFEVGATYKHWPAKTVTESDDHLFCLITMNHHPLHLNDVYAAKSQQKRNVVVGPLVYSLALGMSVSDVSGKAIANLATEELKHPAPVFHGDTLFCESEVLREARVTIQARPWHRQGPHPRLQPGRGPRGRVQAPRSGSPLGLPAVRAPRGTSSSGLPPRVPVRRTVLNEPSRPRAIGLQVRAPQGRFSVPWREPNPRPPSRPLAAGAGPTRH